MSSSHPANFRDVGEMLGLWLEPSPIPNGRLLRGGRIDVLTRHADLGTPRTVLNLRRGPDPKHLEGVRLVHVPASDEVENYDTSARPVRDWLSRALAVLADPATAWPLYVHCTSGRDRTGVVVAAALVLAGVSRAVALEEYLLSEGARREWIELAFDGVLARPAGLVRDVAALQAALGMERVG